MTTLDNPAGRLHALLEAGLRIPNHQKIGPAWRQLLRVEDSDLSELLARLAPVLKLPQEIKEAVLKLEGENHKLLLAWLPNVAKAFSITNFDAQWEHFRTPLDVRAGEL